MGDRLTKAQLDFLRQRRDFPKNYPHWGGMGGSGGSRVRMADHLERHGYVCSWSEDSDYSWQLTDKGRAALAGEKADG